MLVVTCSYFHHISSVYDIPSDFRIALLFIRSLLYELLYNFY